MQRLARVRADRAKERGATLVEFALIAPVLMLLVFGIIEFGFAFNDYLEVRSAAREGARLAAVNNNCPAPCASSGDAMRNDLLTKTKQRAWGLATGVHTGVSYTGTSVGQDVSMCVNYKIRSFTGFFQPVLDNVVLKSKGTMRLEQPATFSQGSTDSPAPTC
jgi:hypothetical protein